VFLDHVISVAEFVFKAGYVDFIVHQPHIKNKTKSSYVLGNSLALATEEIFHFGG